MSSSESEPLSALRAENQDLQARLEEAKELLRVIHAVEVDSNSCHIYASSQTVDRHF